MSINNQLDELKNRLTQDKTLLAGAISDKGVSTAGSDSLQTMASNIALIESGGITSGATFRLNEVTLPEEISILSKSTKQMTACVDAGTSILYTYGDKLYKFNKSTETSTQILTAYNYVEYLYNNSDDGLIVVIASKTSGGQKYYILLNYNLVIQFEIALTTTINSLSCSKIIRNGEYLYILFGSASATLNTVIKASFTSSYILTKTIQSIVNGVSGIYNMVMYNSNIILIGYNMLLIIDSNLGFLNVKGFATNASNGLGYQAHANTFYKTLYLKMNGGNFYTVDAVKFASISEFKTDIITSNSEILMDFPYMYSILNNVVTILDMDNNFRTLATLTLEQKCIFAKKMGDYILMQDESCKLYLYDTSFNLKWKMGYNYELFNLSGTNCSVDIPNTCQFVNLINDNIYLFRNGITKIPLNPTITIK